jgi:hypothetical protein
MADLETSAQGQPEAFQTIKAHMKQQAKGDPSQPGQGEHQQINANRWKRVEGMEADTAPEGIIDGIGQEMIQIDRHCRHHDKGNSFPVFGEGKPCQRDGGRKMKQHVDNRPWHSKKHFA